ncbi:uncharacterized protein LOC111297735 [Durio zibethinus]|uniref:Uncharacterized protein LOC111297735 n=1 Tax=Durio zibethinus TaxID=66656 RepID=A0A6P5Z5R9_DURZI|nr:uncharacterized protein LOC111297735 [Durio zibethinus]
MEAGAILPIDYWQSIFSHLDHDGLEAVSLVCKDFLIISNIYKHSLQVIHPGVDMLSKQLNRFKQLKNINLKPFTGDLDEVILEIARSDISLQVLDICHQDGLKAESLKELGSNSKMKILKVFNCLMRNSNLQDNDLVVIANSFPNLEELDLRIFNFLPNNCLANDSCSPWFPTDFGVEILRNNGVTEKGIAFLLRNKPNLEALSIGNIKMDSSQSTITIENSISHAKALTSLEFSRMDVSDILLIAVAKAELRLTKFVLHFCKKFTVTGLLMVLSNYQLTKLGLVEGDIADVDIELVLSRDVSKLTHIEIKRCQVTSSTLFLLSTRCPSLVEIRMKQIALVGQINDGGINFPLFKNHSVQNLSETMQNYTGIEAILKSCKLIRKLILREYLKKKIIEADNSELPEVNLEDLSLSWTGIDDKGLAALAKRCPRLVSLEASHCDYVTTEGIKQIVNNITTLKYLYMRGCDGVKSGDLLEWMLATGNLASLKKIYLGQNTFTEEQMDQFSHRGCLLR